ncbi:hypothetical protein IWQ47_004998 [Aquimarina sp. EL_43]|nr:hypothetical protein [Aquimarina sp. EL_35]MBG6153743.1 hypothetical protein [Aquimarina sp. EL_32]MBG6171899.1 hypothetical protein [Aquimarina sp. EL_43]
MGLRQAQTDITFLINNYKYVHHPKFLDKLMTGSVKRLF